MRKHLTQSEFNLAQSAQSAQRSFVKLPQRKFLWREKEFAEVNRECDLLSRL